MTNKTSLKTLLIYVLVPMVIVALIYNIDLKKMQESKAAMEKAMPILVRRDSPQIQSPVKYSQIGLGQISTNQEEALADAPEGLDIDPLFELGTFGKKGDNHAEVKHSTTLGQSESSVLKVNDSTQQLSSIWSNVSAGNYIDVSKDQTLSMWLYFGNQQMLRGSGDGMAFVLQNDQRGIGAISTYHEGKLDQRYGKGESLGVWGTDFDKNESSAQNIAKTAIQNSFAIEFDTFADLTADATHPNGQGVSFDISDAIAGSFDESFQHIAMGYPDSPATYQDEGYYGQNYFIMNHISPKSNLFFTDGHWHHVTINWNKGDGVTGLLTYQYNDKNIDGTPNRDYSMNNNGYVNSDSYLTDTQKVDIGHFHLPTKGPNANKLRWGFTGSTGANSQDNLISFETVPSLVNAAATSSLYDDTRDFEIFADHSNQKDTIYTGDDLTFKYHLSYLSGQTDWINIFSKVDMPQGVKFTSADITYADGSTEQVTDPKIDNKELTCKITRPLNDSMKYATLNVHAQAGSQPMKVGKSLAKFKSQYDIIDTQTPEFQIESDQLNLRTDPFGTVNYASKVVTPDSLEVKCYVWEKNQYADPKNVKLFYKLNNSDKSLDLQTLSSQEPTILKIFKQDLRYGENKLEIYAKDSANNFQTPTHTLIINMAGELIFEKKTPSVNFQTDVFDYFGKTLFRAGKWDFEVKDDRLKGNGWTLSVAAGPDPKSKVPFSGNVVYKNESGQEFDLKKPVVIDKQQKSDDTMQETNIVKPWKKDQGILLKSNGNNNPGKYKYDLIWSLTDGI